VKLDIYNRIMEMQTNRRTVLKGAAASAAAIGATGVIGAVADSAFAQGSVRAEILKIPGVGAGSPTDSDWQKVGDLCLGPTKEIVQEGEFAGVELTFMGLNNQNLHNFLFRGFLKPWENYTGAKISWIDLAQADYNPRLQQAIATGTVDFDIVEMGAPFEGDVTGKGLASEMPDWVKDVIDMDDYVGYLKEPVGTWGGKTYRISIDGDCHTFVYRKDYYENEEFAKAWKDEGNEGEWAPPITWQQVNAQSKFLKGKKDPLTGLDAHGYLDPLKGWGGFGFYFLESRATAYAKHPDDPAWLFDPDTMKPRVNNAAFVRAIQDVMDIMDTQPPDQINADPGTTAFQQILAGTGSMISWWGDVGSMARTSDTSVIGEVAGFSSCQVRMMSGTTKRVSGKHWHPVRTSRRTWPISAGAFTSWRGWIPTQRRKRQPGRQRPISAARTFPFGCQPIHQASSLIAIRISSSTSGRKPATIGPILKIISVRTPIATTIPTRRSNRGYRVSSSIILSPKTNWPRAMPASMPRHRKPPTPLRRHGRRSPTRSAGKARLRSTRRHSVCNGKIWFYA